MKKQTKKKVTKRQLESVLRWKRYQGEVSGRFLSVMLHAIRAARMDARSLKFKKELTAAEKELRAMFPVKPCSHDVFTVQKTRMKHKRLNKGIRDDYPL